MSKKIDLDFTIHTLEGDVINETKVVKEDGKPVIKKGKEETEQFPLTLKAMLLTLIPIYPDKERMVFLWDLGLKVKNSEGIAEFENEEFNLIQEVIEKNSFPNAGAGAGTTDRYFPYIIAQTIKYLSEIKEVKEVAEVQEEKKEK